MPDLKKLITLEALQAALPSWLKSSSKPSYTADEISDTNTTNKFVTQSQLNQIGVNQTNILLVESMNGGKNLCDVWGRSGIVTGIKVENTDIGTVRVYGTSTGSSPAAIGLHDIITLPAGNYYFYRNRQGSSVQGTSIQYFKNNTYIASINSDTAYAFTLTEASEVQFKVYFTAGQTVDAVYKPMIITKAVYDAGFTDYQPHALTNALLTKEVINAVNNGAKNLLPDAENSVTSIRWIDYPISIPAGTYEVYIGTFSSDDTDSAKAQVYFFNGTTTLNTFVGITKKSTGMHATITINDTSTFLRIYASSNATLSAGDSITLSKVMVCKKEDWDASPVYAPYRPNWDLVADSIKVVRVTTSDFITTNTNFAILSQTTIFKQSNHIFGTLVIQKTDTAKFVDSLAAVGTIKSGYIPVVNLIGQSYYGTTQWGVDGFGYSYINTSGIVSAKSSTDSSNKYSYVAIPINYMTA